MCHFICFSIVLFQLNVLIPSIYYFLVSQVSIVSCILSLASRAAEPVIPLFSINTIVLAIRTVVDGFLDMYITFSPSCELVFLCTYKTSRTLISIT